MYKCEGSLYPKDGKTANFLDGGDSGVKVGLCDQCQEMIFKWNADNYWAHAYAEERPSDKRPAPDPIERDIEYLKKFSADDEWARVFIWLVDEVRKLKN